MSHRSFRGTLVPIASGLAAIIAVSWFAPAYAAAGNQVTGSTVQAQEWWLGGLHVTQAWKTTEGAGVTVAVLGTGVIATHPDLAGSVLTGPDFSGSGRTAGGPFWGVDGTAVAGVIAGHGHGTGREAGILGIAPAAKILSIRVTLEYNDPLYSSAAIARRLPAAIAAGITYAVEHGARVIDLPLDPGTTGLTGQGDPAAAGGSQAEQAAVSYALSKNVVLVAPAGDDGQGLGQVNYPAAYPGVIAVGAVSRDGQVASFSSRRSYVSVTAPGVSLAAAVPPGDYAPISSTSASSGIVAGVAALVLSRFPHLTAAQVGQALTGGVTPARPGAAGAGRGTIDAVQAVDLAAAIVSASQPRRPARAPAPARPHKLVPSIATAARQPGASALAGSLVRSLVAGLCVLIALLAGLLMIMRRRRERARAAAAETGPVRARGAHGLHEQRKPELPGSAALGALGPVGPLGPPGPLGQGAGGIGGPAGASRPHPPLPGPVQGLTPSWSATGGWQGGGVGEMAPANGALSSGSLSSGSLSSGSLSSEAPFRPAVALPPKPAKTAKADRTASSAGPPWEPAPEPERTFGPLPVVANSALPPDPGPGIRVPGDMAALPSVPPDAPLPVPFDVTASPDPDFPPRPRADDDTDPAIPGFPAGARPTRQSLGFAAAPVPLDYAPPRAPDFTVPSRAAGFVLSAGNDRDGQPAPPAPPAPAGPADPSYIWDLAATDVFPAAAVPEPPPDLLPEVLQQTWPHTQAPGAVPADGDPGAS